MATINKTMKTFNVPSGSDTICYEIVDDAAREDMILVQSSEPTEDCNKLWINESASTEYQVPTEAEFELAVTNLNNKTDDIKSAIEESKADIITVTDSVSEPVKTLTDGADGVPMGIQIAVDPVQDLHGYDNPWPAGGGKNLLPMILDKIKTANTNGTWNGNVYTLNNVAFTVQTDSNDNVLGINVNGTASADTRFNLAKAGVDYGLSGDFIYSSDVNIPQNVYVSLSKQGASNIDITNGDKTKTFTADSTISNARIFINSGVSLTNLLIKPMIRLSTVTDDSFAPYSNICPISGWTEAKLTGMGKNLFSDAITAGKNIDANGELQNQNDRSATVNGCVVKPETTYTLSYQGNLNCGVFFYKKDGSFDSYLAWAGAPRTFTTPANVTLVRFTFYAPTGITYPQLELGSSATAYEPFGSTYTIQFGETVYGGTLTVNKDGTGSLVPDVAYEDLTNKAFTKAASGNGRFNIAPAVNNMRKPQGRNAYIISTHFKGVTETGIDLTSPFVFVASDTNIVVQTGDASIDTVEKFNAWLTAQSNAGTPVMICYKVYVPYEPIQLTAPQVKSLLGVNNLYADTGNILSVDYAADTKLYVDNLFASLTNATGVSF